MNFERLEYQNDFDFTDVVVWYSKKKKHFNCSVFLSADLSNPPQIIKHRSEDKNDLRLQKDWFVMRTFLLFPALSASCLCLSR